MYTGDQNAIVAHGRHVLGFCKFNDFMATFVPGYMGAC